MTATEAAPADLEHAITELFADAPPVGKAAVKKLLEDMKARGELEQQEFREPITAGRVGARLGKVAELTILAPLAPGGAKRLRGFIELMHGDFATSDRIGTLHDMRFVFVNNDTELIFATTYDGDWDPYIDDFATKMPDALDVIFSACKDWPGIRDPKIKDWIVRFQIPAAGWYVANPDLTVADTRRLSRIGKAVDEFLDKVA